LERFYPPFSVADSGRIAIRFGIHTVFTNTSNRNELALKSSIRQIFHNSMQPDFKFSLCSLLVLLAWPLCAQDLSPRAYVITPENTNAIILTWAFFDGGINLNGSVPIKDATGTYSVPSFSYYHSFGLLRRSANVTVSLPYGVGTFRGEVNEQQKSVYRSGLADFVSRVSVNLLGGPAMPARDFVEWKQKIILGASLKVLAPTGQYSPNKVINWGINRWGFKPELGYSERWGNWLLDAYLGGWFYTTNQTHFAVPIPKPQTEEPIGSFEGHISRNFGLGTWASLDGNFWWGGVTALSGIQDLSTKQTSSRLGGTVAWRFAKHQSLKFSYSHGTYVRFGGDYHNVQAGWQYSWIGQHLRR
jgi:hypothetical protein